MQRVAFEVEDYADAVRILGESPDSVRWKEYMEPIMEEADDRSYDPENLYPVSLPEVFYWRRDGENGES
jgi:L-rhamnose mutarotase